MTARAGMLMQLAIFSAFEIVVFIIWHKPIMSSKGTVNLHRLKAGDQNSQYCCYYIAVFIYSEKLGCGGKKKSDSEFLSYNLMLNSGKKIRALRDKK
jgi:hypothetical protein